jgi:hypothetical protein
VQAGEHIYTMNPDGSGVFKVTTIGSKGHKDATQTGWSLDGGRIAFRVSDGDISVVNVDGSRLRRLTKAGRNQGPVWSPDGTKIAFAAAARAS